jgi:histidine triad (HIT) family protein
MVMMVRLIYNLVFPAVRASVRFSRPASARIVGFLFTHMSAVLPVQYLRQTATLVAFYHPSPVYAFHVLLVPKRGVASLGDLSEQDNDFLADLFQTVRSLVTEYHLEEPGYRLIANGGGYQDFPQVHFHLVSGEPS